MSFGSPLPADFIHTMTNILRHRGPDDEGYLAVATQSQPLGVVELSGPDSAVKGLPAIDIFTGEVNFYLGHRRLAIVDLSPAGHQPMRYGDHLWGVFNGEIYNYVELRTELKAKGFEFNTGSDTEVLLAAYSLWGEQCVTRFNGDWAFCILDLMRNVLFLSRDRYGIKPLYFFRSDEHFAFASEIKALLSLPFVPRVLNREQASHYYVMHIKNYNEDTLFETIHQLLPGQNMRVHLRSGMVQKCSYYTVPYHMELGEYDHSKAKAYADDVRDLLFDAVRLRLRADVPIGTCLSGGLDSSAIVAIMGRILKKEVSVPTQKTFTVSFPGESVDESGFARLAAKNSGATSYFVYPSREGYRHDLPTVLYHQDEPFGGPSIYAQWEVMHEAAKHVKVVLDGQGGDEVFAGYRDYRVSYLAQLLSTWHVRQLTKELWYTVKHARTPRSAVAEVKALPFYALGNWWKQRIYRLGYRRQIKLAQQTFGLESQVGLEHIDRKFTSNLNELLFYYMTTYSLPYLLRGEDRNSMAHSIEARVPFTDHRLVDYVFSLPAAYKIRYGWTKWLLRLAVEDLLPPEIVWRKDKMGFATPQWGSRWEEWRAWMQLSFHATDLHSHGYS